MTPTDCGATWSPCQTYRYTLWRGWRGFFRPACDVAFIGLNPSTADATTNDPTVRRCINLAKAWGYGRMWMLNIFAFRATDPAVMRAASDPVGPGNDAALCKIAGAASLVVACWGVHGAYRDRGEAVRLTLRGRAKLYHMGLTVGGQPRHPLYLPGTVTPTAWEL